MTIFGKRLSEYFAFCKPILGLILVVGIARFALSLGGVPNSLVKWVSLTAVMWIGVVYFSIRVHTSGFGTYKHLLPICVLQSLAAQAIIVPAIILAIFTGQDNIFSIPENFFGNDGKTWLHVAGHLFIGGTTIGPLISWLIGCLIMFVTKKVGSRGTEAKATAGA
ncbi:MAG TPA: hypothetical protein VLM38_13975 [Blastocatellia bacterium]|nr:hypothetical protein [Blastocatellia bacterium]